MPSFDVVSKVDKHEISNAVDQANREIKTRFDFKGVDASFDLQEESVVLTAPSDFQIKQMQDILSGKFVKRGLDTRSLEYKDIEANLSQAKQTINVKQGISPELAKKMVKFIKESKVKVQPAIQGDEIRVTGKKRDDLQAIIAQLKEHDFELPLQFVNFRD